VTGGVAEETRILREANAELQSGDAARALGLLDAHARAFPSGALGEERSAQRVFALCKLGRVAEARAEATRFTKANPESPLAKNVRSSCAGDTR
jgi:outer membrane protein assembly factor BamD (BamD/ComL family)